MIELADMIYRLRAELSRAMWSGDNADIRFRADAVDLELTVGLERTTDPSIKVRFWVLDLAHDVRTSSLATQKITLRLRPFYKDSPDESAIISGASMSGES